MKAGLFTFSKNTEMTSKKNAQNQPKITSFYSPLATSSSSFVAKSSSSSVVAQTKPSQVSLGIPKVLSDSTNTHQKKKQKSESIPINPNVIGIDSSHLVSRLRFVVVDCPNS